MVDIAKNTATAAPIIRPHIDQMPAGDGPRPAGVAPVGTAGRVGIDGRDPTRERVTEPGAGSAVAARYLLAGVRISLGWIFLWAFLDKTFGLGFATPAARAWVDGGSPTNGFLSSAKGPFSDFYKSIAGTGAADVLFMAALLGVGVALILGIGVRVAAGVGALLTVMMWTAVLPPTSNPFMDDHLIYAAVLVVLALVGAGNTLGLGRAWSATALVQRAPWLK
jgi:thiosulfate dehydrogenase [quinone] large subunit